MTGLRVVADRRTVSGRASLDSAAKAAGVGFELFAPKNWCAGRVSQCHGAAFAGPYSSAHARMLSHTYAKEPSQSTLLFAIDTRPNSPLYATHKGKLERDHRFCTLFFGFFCPRYAPKRLYNHTNT